MNVLARVIGTACSVLTVSLGFAAEIDFGSVVTIPWAARLDGDYAHWNNMQFDGLVMEFMVSEEGQGGLDLNGDGYRSNVLHLFDYRTGLATNLGSGHVLDDPGADLGDGILVYSLPEMTADLNADGDIDYLFDQVVQVLETRTGAWVNTGLPGTAPIYNNGRILIGVPEAAQGHTDLNGDGDARDLLGHIYEISTGIVTNLNTDINWVSGFGRQFTVLTDPHRREVRLHRLADRVTQPPIPFPPLDEFQAGRLHEPNLVAAIVKELDTGLDLNGDGDVGLERLLYLYDIAADRVFHVPLSVSGAYRVAGRTILLLVREASQGMTDLNGDGDVDDEILHRLDWQTGAIENLRVNALNGMHMDGTLVAFWVSESAQGDTDLNGDGDTLDTVIHTLDLATGVIRNLGLAYEAILGPGNDSAPPTQVQGNRIAFAVNEASQGHDLNRDGDMLDYVLHLHSAASGVTRNLEQSVDAVTRSIGEPIDGFVFRLQGDLLALNVSEAGQGGRDLNLDGDHSDSVLHVFDMESGAFINVGQATGGTRMTLTFRIVGDRIAFSAFEDRRVDLNGDGDVADSVPAILDLDTDGDGIRNLGDNCPRTANPDQADADGDLAGDACDLCPLDTENDADRDGVCGDVDACPESDIRPLLIIGTCETGVANPVDAAGRNGCTLSDEVSRCERAAVTHGAYVSCTARLAHQLLMAGVIVPPEQAAIVVCAARDRIPTRVLPAPLP